MPCLRNDSTSVGQIHVLISCILKNNQGQISKKSYFSLMIIFDKTFMNESSFPYNYNLPHSVTIINNLVLYLQVVRFVIFWAKTKNFRKP